MSGRTVEYDTIDTRTRLHGAPADRTSDRAPGLYQYHYALPDQYHSYLLHSCTRLLPVPPTFDSAHLRPMDTRPSHQSLEQRI
jgi:hypothetical protein